MAQKSLYDMLLVDQNATLEEIKLAFKRRALQVHPDKGGSKEEFHLVYQALETLGDPAARQKYDYSLATASKKTEAAPHPKSKKGKREDKPGHPATSCKAETKTKPPTPGKKSTTSAGKAPSRPTRARATTGATSTPAEPQSKQTKLLMKIRDLLKQLPRDARNDVITNQFSQKQRLILEKFMVDNADTSSGTKCHFEAEALVPTSGLSDLNPAGRSMASPVTNSAEANQREKKRHPKKRATSSFDAIYNEPADSATSSTMQVSHTQSFTREGAETRAPPYTEGSMQEMNSAMDVKHGKGYYSVVANSKHGRSPDIEMISAKRPAEVKAQSKRRAFNGSGCVHRAGPHSALYLARIRFDSIEMRTGKCCDLKTALEDLMVLTVVKQKMRNHTGAGTFVERLQAAVGLSAAEQGRSLTDLKLSFLVLQSAGRFIGSQLRSPSVRSLEVFGKMRSLFEPFRQYAKKIGSHSVYWHFSPAHLEDAWERFQSAVARAWQLAGVDSTATLQKICSLYEAQAPFRIANLQRWEQQQMARQDNNKHRPKKLRERNPAEETSRQLSALKNLIARWGRMLKREAKLVEQERQKVIRRRLEVLKQKRQREEERLRRECVRERMRSDITLDDIRRQKSKMSIAIPKYAQGRSSNLS